jgi:hypothetical protein
MAFMRRFFVAALVGAATLSAALVAAPTASAAVTKITFNDVVLPDGRIGEITANTKASRNREDSYYCGYFTDNFQESLGYYFNFLEPAPASDEELLALCLARFDRRFT